MASSSMDQAMICSICLDDYEIPKILTCFHTFCLQCLEQHAGRTTVTGSFPCPQCRQMVAIPAGGVRGFQTNFYITNLREKDKSVVPQQEAAGNASKLYKMCMGCRNKEAVFDCRTCQKTLCSGCKKNHRKNKKYRNHHIIVLKEDPAAENPESILCEKHKSRGEILAYFCVRCNIPICMSCKLTSHEGHKTEDMDDRMNDIKKNLRENGFVVQRMSHTLEDMKESVLKTEVNHHSNVDEVLKHITTDRTNVINLVTSRSKVLEAKFKKRAQTELENLSSHIQNIDTQMVQLETTQNEISNTLSKGTYQEMLTVNKGLKRRLETMKKEFPDEKIVCAKFSYDKVGYDKSIGTQIDNVLGKIVTDVSEVNKHMMPKGTKILTTFTIPKNIHQVKSLTTSKQGILICYDPAQKCMDTVTTTGSLKTSAPFNFDVTAIHALEDGVVYLASASQKRLFLLSHYTFCNVGDIPLPPTAITLSRNKEIIVVGHSKAMKAGILVVDILLNARWIYKDEDGIVFKKPSDIAYWFKGNQCMVIVTDPKAHRVVFFSKQGDSGWHLAKIYSGEGLHKDEEQFAPHGVCVDKLGNIFVTDTSSQAVIQLSRKGHLMEDQTIRFDHGFVPTAITSTVECHLVVGSNSNQVKVIKRGNC